MRHDLVGSRHADDVIRATIAEVFERRGYLLDPHSAIAYLGLKQYLAASPKQEPDRIGIFLATAHPAKFREIVEPVIGKAVETPGPLAEALARPRNILRIDASLDAVAATLAT